MTNQALAADQAAIEDAPADADFQIGQVATLGVGHLVQDTYTAFLSPLLPLLQTQLGVGYALAGSLAIFTQLPSVLNPFIGYLADRISVRYFVILAPAVTATVFTSLGLASSYATLALLLLVGGVAIAAFHAPAPAMVAKVSGQRVGTGMSIFMATGELARTLGPLVAVAGVAWFGLDGIWRMAAAGWLMSLILYLRLRRVPATPRAPGSLAMDAFWRQARQVFPALIWLLAGRSLMVAALTTYLPIFMSDERQASLWLAAAGIAGHGAFDFFVHPSLVTNPGMPVWWPGFCGTIDFVIGGWLAGQLWRASKGVEERRASEAGGVRVGDCEARSSPELAQPEGVLAP